MNQERDEFRTSGEVRTISTATLEQRLRCGPDRSPATADRPFWRGAKPPTLYGSPRAVPLRSDHRHNRMSKNAD
ncbi:hypothetical protein CEE69_00170 [Rhodopirellula bahusiensis]|uniref:Uncharacterized protein n=1 Tax=Rhodopirellula bahusiensis TaxID=2014065 RepID=A0A2G1WCY4_9BACT|nr:hypothetical protein CEE69_00170 [Rhodopirellula bahusiensis]